MMRDSAVTGGLWDRRATGAPHRCNGACSRASETEPDTHPSNLRIGSSPTLGTQAPTQKRISAVSALLRTHSRFGRESYDHPREKGDRQSEDRELYSPARWVVGPEPTKVNLIPTGGTRVLVPFERQLVLRAKLYLWIPSSIANKHSTADGNNPEGAL